MHPSRISKLFGAVAGLSLLLGACAPNTPAPTSAPVATDVPATTAPEPTSAPSGEPITLHIMHNWSDDDPKARSCRKSLMSSPPPTPTSSSRLRSSRTWISP